MHLRASCWWNARSCDCWFYDILAWQNNILMEIITSVLSKYFLYGRLCLFCNALFLCITVFIWYVYPKNSSNFSLHLSRIASLIYFRSKFARHFAQRFSRVVIIEFYTRLYLYHIWWQINNLEKRDILSIWLICPLNSEFYTTDIISMHRDSFLISLQFFME